MTGVQQMVDRILTQAGAERDAKLAQAQTQAEARLAAVGEELARQEQQARVQSEQQAAETVAFAHSAAGLIRRNAMLAQRRELIGQTIEQMLQQLRGLPDGEYFDLLQGMVTRAAQPGVGTLCLGKRDLARLPADFAARIAAPAPGSRVTVSDRPAAIDGGFILRYAQTDMDCSFDALLEEKREQIEDLIQQELFAG